MTWQINGHEWAAQLLREHIARGEVRHAYLFTGPQGSGRRTLALQFAQALNCTNPPAPGEFCGECRVCRQTAAMQHIDLSVVQAEEDSTTLKIEQVREVQHLLTLLPYEAHYRVALMLHFEDATPSAQNALLKTLEEAPQRVILLLTADSVESLLPTIISRCEVLRLRPMPLNRLQETLRARQLSAEDAALLAHLAGGRLGYALRLQEDSGYMEQRRALVDDLLGLLSADRRERFVYAEAISKDKKALREAFQVWLSLWRDLMLRSASPGLPLVNLDQEEAIAALVGQIDLQTARARVVDLERGIARLDANVNARLLTEVILLDWPYLEGEPND
jgi:DNA polymerase-3 subunit delta'